MMTKTSKKSNTKKTSRPIKKNIVKIQPLVIEQHGIEEKQNVKITELINCLEDVYLEPEVLDNPKVYSFWGKIKKFFMGE